MLVAQLLQEQVVATLPPRGKCDGLVGAVTFEVPLLPALDALLGLIPFQLRRGHGLACGSSSTSSSSCCSLTCSTSCSLAASSSTSTSAKGIDVHIVVIILFVLKVFIFLFVVVDVEVVEVGTLFVATCSALGARYHEVVDGVVCCPVLNSTDSFVDGHVEFDPGCQIPSVQRSDEVEDLVVLGEVAR